MSVEVLHEPQNSRYTVWEDEAFVGLAEYLERGPDIVFTHTEIDPAHRHEGLGNQLVQFALDDARARFAGHIVPACPFVMDFVAENPDYQDLVAH